MGWISSAISACLLAVYIYLYFPTSHTFPPGSVVLICGASSGIGEELAYQLAEQQARLVLVARTVDKLEKVRKKALARGAAAVEVIQFDMSRAGESGSVVERTVELFGKLDYLVLNHAAMFYGAFLAFPHQQEQEFIEKVFRVNIFSHIQLTVTAIPYLEATGGHIFVTSSIAGELPFTYGIHLYSSTKHAINGFFYNLQQELIAKQSAVTITVGALGPVWTADMELLMEGDVLPVKRVSGSVEDCAGGILQTYFTRPHTWTFPKPANYLMRAMWYFIPTSIYHKLIIYQSKIPGSEGYGYKEKVEDWDKKVDIAKQNGFQQGYYEKSTGKTES